MSYCKAHSTQLGPDLSGHMLANCCCCTFWSFHCLLLLFLVTLLNHTHALHHFEIPESPFLGLILAFNYQHFLILCSIKDFKLLKEVAWFLGRGIQTLDRDSVCEWPHLLKWRYSDILVGSCCQRIKCEPSVPFNFFSCPREGNISPSEKIEIDIRYMRLFLYLSWTFSWLLPWRLKGSLLRCAEDACDLGLNQSVSLQGHLVSLSESPRSWSLRPQIQDHFVTMRLHLSNHIVSWELSYKVDLLVIWLTYSSVFNRWRALLRTRLSIRDLFKRNHLFYWKCL